ncbi:MAG: hypothetical protein WAN46_09450 [Gammaproteobacteria bacterium]
MEDSGVAKDRVRVSIGEQSTHPSAMGLPGGAIPQGHRVGDSLTTRRGYPKTSAAAIRGL